MPGFLALIPSWAWRWIAIIGVGIALYGGGRVQQYLVDEVKYDRREAQIQAAGDAQNAKTAQIVKDNELRKEKADVEAKTRETALVAERDAALKRLSDSTRRRIVPAPSAGTSSSSRLCLSSEVLDRGLREALGRLQQRTLAIAAEGQRAANVAALCRDNWPK